MANLLTNFKKKITVKWINQVNLLKTMIFASSPYPKSIILTDIVVFSGRTLNNKDTSLNEYGITNESTIYFIQNPISNGIK